jgi:hypothetical protein
MGMWDGNRAQLDESHYAPEKNAQIVREAGIKILLDKIDAGGNEKHQIIMAEAV